MELLTATRVRMMTIATEFVGGVVGDRNCLTELPLLPPEPGPAFLPHDGTVFEHPSSYPGLSAPPIPLGYAAFQRSISHAPRIIETESILRSRIVRRIP
jgi:hypothetical protein